MASLWLFPLAVIMVGAGRVLAGIPLLSREEARYFFGAQGRKRSAVWKTIQFTALAALFFVAGLIEGLVLLNFSSLWMVIVPLLTGLCATLAVLVWLR